MNRLSLLVRGGLILVLLGLALIAPANVATASQSQEGVAAPVASTSLAPCCPKVYYRWVCAYKGLHLRAGPGLGYQICASMPYGSRVSVIGGPVSANGYKWYKVIYGRYIGWAAGSWLGGSCCDP